jgi:hypothetical protein
MKGLRGGDPAPRIQRPQLAAPEPVASAPLESAEAAPVVTPAAEAAEAAAWIEAGLQSDPGLAPEPVADAMADEATAVTSEAREMEPGEMDASEAVTTNADTVALPSAPDSGAPQPAPVLELGLEPGQSHGFLGDVQL